jgi:hypothetical protein
MRLSEGKEKGAPRHLWARPETRPKTRGYTSTPVTLLNSSNLQAQLFLTAKRAYFWPADVGIPDKPEAWSIVEISVGPPSFANENR